MTWWTEAPYWLREVLAMFGTFFAVTFGVCGLAWAVDRRQQRRRK